MNFECWFPTVTAYDMIAEEAKVATRKKIDDWIESGKHKEYIELCGMDNLTTSFFKWHDTIGDLNLTELHSEIKSRAIVFLDHFGLTVTEDQIRVDSWINFFYPGQSEQQHNHYGNLMSGVYYVTAPKGSGAYAFFDPANQKVMWQNWMLPNRKENFINKTSSQYIPEEGKIIMFPSWLDHAVYANKSNDVRISIAFNVNKVK